MDRYIPVTIGSNMVEHESGYWVNYEDAMAEIAKLEGRIRIKDAKYQYLTDNLPKVKADA